MILVLGGKGKTGSRVAARLREKGIAARLASRSETPAFDWNDETTWKDALKDVNAVYISYQPDLGVPGAAATVKRFASQAADSGVKRLVLLSGRGEEGAMLAEQAIQKIDAEWTIVRASWFYQNFNEGFLVESVLAGEIALPVGAVTEPFIDVEDIADIAVEALTGNQHLGKLYDVTGPRLMSFADVAAEISQVLGRPVRYVPIAMEDFVTAMRQQGAPEGEVEMLRYLFAEVLDGRNAQLTDGVQQALGRRPRDFGQYARAAAASGVWR